MQPIKVVLPHVSHYIFSHMAEHAKQAYFTSNRAWGFQRSAQPLHNINP